MVNVLKFQNTKVSDKMAYAKVQTKISLLPQEQSDQGLCSLPFHLVQKCIMWKKCIKTKYWENSIK